MKFYPDKLGDYIAKEREKKFPSRIVFGKKIGLDPSTIGLIENGDTKKPGLDSILAIAEGLKIDPMKLISVYKGVDPDQVEDPLEVESSVVDFVSHLPDRIVMQALCSRPEQEVFEKLLAIKGEAKMRELMQEALRQKEQDKS